MRIPVESKTKSSRLRQYRDWARRVALVLLALQAPVAPQLAVAQSGASSEYQLKAAFLFNLTKFIDWPDKSFAGSKAPFIICVIGQDPFGQALDNSMAGQMIGDRVVEVDRYPAVRNLNEAQGCQIVFVSASEKQRFRKVINFFQGKSALLVGDTDGFASAGGVIEFQMEDGHVHFAINPEAADRASLTVSSKLLALAKIVHGDPGTGKS